MFTFILVSSLFLLWGFCNGMIDVMDKHFQEELGLTKSQSAWVQFAHYLGYFLMSIPAGWLASKLGYKGGIITGLLIVAVGGFWFIPATHINAMVHAGQRLPQHGVRRLPGRRLRHRHRPDVSGDHRQSVHDGAGRSTLRGHPHQSGAVLQRHRLDLRPDRRQHVLLLARTPRATAPAARRSTSPTSASPSSSSSSPSSSTSPTSPTSRPRTTTTWTTPRRAFRTPSGRIPHFVMAVAAQFFYVAAQAGIFSFFINYMTVRSSRPFPPLGTRA